MSIVLEKLDARHTGHTLFQYRVPLYGFEEFLKIRKFCWETWGASCEIDLITVELGQLYNDIWSWRLVDPTPRKYRFRPVGFIYLSGGEQAAFFKLKYG